MPFIDDFERDRIALLQKIDFHYMAKDPAVENGYLLFKDNAIVAKAIGQEIVTND